MAGLRGGGQPDGAALAHDVLLRPKEGVVEEEERRVRPGAEVVGAAAGNGMAGRKGRERYAVKSLGEGPSGMTWG